MINKKVMKRKRYMKDFMVDILTHIAYRNIMQTIKNDKNVIINIAESIDDWFAPIRMKQLILQFKALICVISPPINKKWKDAKQLIVEIDKYYDRIERETSSATNIKK